MSYVNGLEIDIEEFTRMGLLNLRHEVKSLLKEIENLLNGGLEE